MTASLWPIPKSSSVSSAASPDRPTRTVTSYGSRTSGAEFDRSIKALYENAPSMPSPEEEKELRRRELDLMIDHRLGRDFPKSRRDKLCSLQERMDKRWLLHSLTLLVKRRLGLFSSSGKELADALRSDYSEVLTPDELRAFLDDDRK